MQAEVVMLRLLLMGLLLFLTGCAPRYVIQNEYITSASASFAPCVERCSVSQQTCQTQCQQRYQLCLDEAYAKAKAVEQEELKAYEHEYGRYRMDFSFFQSDMYRWRRDFDDVSRDFNYFQKRCTKDKEVSACQKRDELRRYLNRLNYERPREPRMPMRPSFEQILLNQQTFCSTDCGCEQAYDGCFTACGGRVIPHKICIEYCD